MKKLIFIPLVVLLFSCGEDEAPVPKPRGYMRLAFPEKSYQRYENNCPFTFDYPVYANIVQPQGNMDEPCNKNIDFPTFNGTLHLTYKHLNNNVAQFIEDCHNLVYQHTVKAYDISTNQYLNDSTKVYGLLYDISGNAASPLQFYLTDSTTNFVRGALYFNVRPNYDSIRPVLDYVHEDVLHMLKTFSWKSSDLNH